MFLPGDAGVLAAAKALGPPEWGGLRKGPFLKDSTYFHWLSHQRTDQDLLPLPCAPLRSLGHSPPWTMAGSLHPPSNSESSYPTGPELNAQLSFRGPPVLLTVANSIVDKRLLRMRVRTHPNLA